MTPDSLLKNAVLLAAMVAIMTLMLRGARPRRQGTVLHARTLTFLRRYEDTSLWPSLITGSLAFGTLLEAGSNGGAALGTGLSLGLFCVVFWTFLGPLVNVVLAVISVVAAFVDIWNLHYADGDWPSVVFSYFLLAVLTYCYFGGAVIAGHTGWISSRRALVYFCVVDIVLFMAGPGGAQIYTLEPKERWFYLAVSCAACVAFGALDLDFVVVLAAAAMTVTGALITSAGFGAKAEVLVAAVAVALVVRGFAKRIGLVRTP
jgi:hypothetical protein